MCPTDYFDRGLDGILRLITLLVAASCWGAFLLIFAHTFTCYMGGSSVCSVARLLVPVSGLQYALHVFPILRIPVALGMLCFGAASASWWLLGCGLNSNST
jgi:hypothetical protein